MNRTPIFDTFREILGRGFSDSEVVLINAAIDEAEGITPQAQAHQLTAPDQFFSAIRNGFGGLEQHQVDGFNFLLESMGAARWSLSWAAYALATAWHETNETMQPVKEAYWLSEQWRKANLRYYPWYGRGYVQLTWEKNYRDASQALGLGQALISDPDLALDPEVAARVLVWGMEAGAFTRKALKDYLPLSGKAGVGAFTEARRIINGTDKAEKIAKEAVNIQAALGAGGWA